MCCPTDLCDPSVVDAAVAIYHTVNPSHSSTADVAFDRVQQTYGLSGDVRQLVGYRCDPPCVQDGHFARCRYNIDKDRNALVTL